MPRCPAPSPPLTPSSAGWRTWPPAFFTEAGKKLTDLRGHAVTDVPFDVLGTDSLDHFRFVVTHRDRLRPQVGRADDAINPATIIREDPRVVAAPRGHGRLTPGSAQ